MVYCEFLEKEAEGLDFQLYPGEIGKRIYEHISKEAWFKWMQKQTILVNEYHLKLLNPDDRKFIENKMIDFLFNKKNVDPKEFVKK